MSRRDKYKQHLQSKEWKELRSHALERTSGFCQFCGDIATQVHHAKYPKQFGDEHPNSLIPVCKKCHNISHGVQEMKVLSEATIMTDLSPSGIQLKYLLSSGRVYASAQSWMKALQIPKSLTAWFESSLSRTATLKSERAGGALEMTYLNTSVYRWHAVADLLRAFDRQWYQSQFNTRTKYEQKEIQIFHENYERIVNWGYELQERALSSILNPVESSDKAVTQETLLTAIKDAVAPRLREHDGKLNEHDIIITEIQNAVPVLRDQEEFITIKQAISEQGLDGTSMPLYPSTKENLSGLAGQRLKKNGAEQGSAVISRIDGQSFTTPMNTYRRNEIYKILDEISVNKQQSLI